MFLKGHESQIARICGWGRRLTLIKIHSVNVGGMNWIRNNEVIFARKYMCVQENSYISLKSNLYRTFFPDVITVHCDKID